MEKRAVIEEGLTPPEESSEGEKKGSASPSPEKALEEHLTKRLAEAMAEGEGSSPCKTLHRCRECVEEE